MGKPQFLKCDRCGGKMVKGRRSRPGGCIMFLIGFILLFFHPIGTIIGVILILGGITMGNEHFWVCKDCKTKIPREHDWWEFG